MMKRLSLPAIRSRVDRLVRESNPGIEETVMLVHWLQPYDDCPACGHDLAALASDEAVERAMQTAREQHGAEAPSLRVRFVSWPRELGTCPRCGASLP
jgi:uncharacterized protein (DUF983 family)